MSKDMDGMEELDRLCHYCDKRKPDVVYRIDPYLQDVWGEEHWLDICDACHEMRAADV